MSWFRHKKNRLRAAIATGAFTLMLMTGAPKIQAYNRDTGQTLAWWGTLYPKFCFSQRNENEPMEIDFWFLEKLENLKEKILVLRFQ